MCSGRNAERALRLGASHVIDYARQDFTRNAEPYDVLLDVAGSRSLTECLAVLKPEGTYVAIGGPVKDPWLKPLLRLLWISLRGALAKQRVAVFVTNANRESLDALTELIEAGRILPAVETRCDLAELPAVMREVESGKRQGKVAVRII